MKKISIFILAPYILELILIGGEFILISFINWKIPEFILLDIDWLNVRICFLLNLSMSIIIYCMYKVSI